MTTSSSRWLEDVGEVGLVGAEEGLHLRQQRLLAQVEADHLRHVGVDGLVVGDACPGRVRDRDVARAVRVEEAGGAEQRLAPEDQWVEEVVVDPAVDHVHALQPARRAHEDDVLVADEVASLHELDPHLAREERVLVVGGVVHAGREQDDGEVAARRRGSDRVQDGEQLLRVVVDARDAVPLEELGEGALHRRPVLEHVARAGGTRRLSSSTRYSPLSSRITSTPATCA